MVYSQVIRGTTYIFCNCYECYQVSVYENNFHHGGYCQMTQLQYNQHKTDRRMAYNAYIENKISIELEHSAYEGDGGIVGEVERTGSVPTFFDIGSGELADNIALNGSARWATLHRASIKKA